MVSTFSQLMQKDELCQICPRVYCMDCWVADYLLFKAMLIEFRDEKISQKER